MSKREGTYVFLDNIIKNIGKDVTRFIMLTRKNTEKLELLKKNYHNIKVKKFDIFKKFNKFK